VGLKKKNMDKKVVHGKLMNQHRLISNEIADIKASSYELSPQQKERVNNLERQLMMIMNQLHQLYNQ
jgi:hypothetical protein